jgi:hypothetical protein
MVIEVAIICVTLIILAAMGFVYLERSKPKPVQVIPELEKIKQKEIRILAKKNKLTPLLLLGSHTWLRTVNCANQTYTAMETI